ncbi:hypothetical protein chiPu_0027635 [Chiloscyllium punctatum]|uniref:Uncharacterized protein n=1 Tax=Chiloscyllium punctatum TaxID=137246 RepID=A0A401TL79_CHIPU|nr:hypothetical protein [Chiloscyllium punctatum]
MGVGTDQSAPSSTVRPAPPPTPADSTNRCPTHCDANNSPAPRGDEQEDEPFTAAPRTSVKASRRPLVGDRPHPPIREEALGDWPIAAQPSRQIRLLRLRRTTPRGAARE